MEDLMHDDKQVVTTPLWISGDELIHDTVDLLNDLHLKELLKAYISWGYDGSDDLEGRCVELRVTHLEVLKEHLNKPKLLQDHHKGLVSLDNNRE